MTLSISLQIQAGKFKGKKIFTPNAVNGHSNFTPSAIKKSVFSIIESEFLSGNIEKEKSVFIDFFAGSGQMGIEAISRGFKRCIFFELDKSRFQFLKETIQSFEGNFQLNHKDCFRYVSKIEMGVDEVPIFFLDPPYGFWKDENKIKKLYEDLDLLFSRHILIIQCPNEVKWEGLEQKGRGNNQILVKKRLN